MIFDILIRNRLKLLCITGDMQKAFLQIKVDPRDRDALRFLWYENLDSRTVVQYRFTRVIFGSGPSAYIPGATLKMHVSQYADKYPSTTDELLKNIYVDDIQSGGDHKDELVKFKKEATKIMEDGGFHLHKWHSNVPEVEEPQTTEDDAVPSQASLTYPMLEGDHVPTSDNPSDQGSRGAEPRKLGELWFKGPSWLSNLHKYASYWKLLRLTAFVRWFIDNCKKTEKRKGPLQSSRKVLDHPGTGISSCIVKCEPE